MGSTSASTTVPAAAQVNNVTASTPIIVPSPAVVTGLPTIPDFRPSNVVNSAPSNINPLVYQPHYQYIPVDPLSSGMNSYYSQPMYVDQLGQPIYYRVGKFSAYNSFVSYLIIILGAQEVVYTSPDGNTMAAGVDPNVQYVQIPVNNYWPNPQDPNVQMMQGVNGQLYAHPGIPTYQTIDANGMVRRVLYNPALGYSSNGMMNMNPGKMIPAMYMQGHPQIMENHDVNYPNGVQRDEYYNRNDDHDISRNRNGRVDRNNNNNRIDKSTRKNISTPNLNNNSASTNTPSRDSLVEEFRNTYGKGRQWSLRDLTGHVVAFCQDQHGSRFIQQRLEVCSDNEKQVVFDEVIPTANLLMTDVFGNYVLQKLFEFGACEQCDMLSSLLVGQCVELSMQMYGCRVVQKALEYVSISRLVVLVSEFEDPDVLLNCVHDANGNHVIQKCIEVISKAARDSTDKEMKQYLNNKILLIINTFRNKVKELSSHPYGCRVIQRILEHCNNSQKSIVLEELRQCCTELVQDCYGNYVIQFVMQHGWDDDRAILIKEVHANLLDFSQHKFASNVVEKCLQYAVKRDRDEMIWKIINATFDPKSPIDGKGNSALETMVRDPYANYVVQKVIDVSDEKQRGAILRYVKDNIQQLRRYTYGKHIIMRLEKITNEKF